VRLACLRILLRSEDDWLLSGVEDRLGGGVRVRRAKRTVPYAPVPNIPSTNVKPPTRMALPSSSNCSFSSTCCGALCSVNGPGDGDTGALIVAACGAVISIRRDSWWLGYVPLGSVVDLPAVFAGYCVTLCFCVTLVLWCVRQSRKTPAVVENGETRGRSSCES